MNQTHKTKIATHTSAERKLHPELSNTSQQFKISRQIKIKKNVRNIGTVRIGTDSLKEITQRDR